MIVTLKIAAEMLCIAPGAGPHARCAGDRCMAWRWAEGEEPRRTHLAEEDHHPKEPPRPARVPASWTWCRWDPDNAEPAQWVEPEEEANARRLGFCGLAGRPESEFSL